MDRLLSERLWGRAWRAGGTEGREGPRCPAMPRGDGLGETAQMCPALGTSLPALLIGNPTFIQDSGPFGIAWCSHGSHTHTYIHTRTPACAQPSHTPGLSLWVLPALCDNICNAFAPSWLPHQPSPLVYTLM